jgi:hypothetical protein
MFAINLFKCVLETDPNIFSHGEHGAGICWHWREGKALECLDKALELDPEYEIAAVNRIGIEKMREGERLEGKIESVNYYRDYQGRGKKSYIAEILGNVRDLLKRD